MCEKMPDKTINKPGGTQKISDEQVSAPKASFWQRVRDKQKTAETAKTTEQTKTKNMSAEQKASKISKLTNQIRTSTYVAIGLAGSAALFGASVAAGNSSVYTPIAITTLAIVSAANVYSAYRSWTERNELKNLNLREI